MKKNLINIITVLVLISIIQNSFGKNSEDNNTLTDCNQEFYDTGGVSGEYSNNENYTVTFCPDNIGEIIIANFDFFELEDNYDFLNIYDGNDNTFPLIGQFTGTNIPVNIGSSVDSCLTFEFISDYSNTLGGWHAAITCNVPPLCTAPTQIVVDSISDTYVNLFFNDTNIPAPSAWEIEYGLAGFTQGSGTSIILNASYFTLSNLEINTTYDIYIRTICNETENSYWSGVQNFTTVDIPNCNELFLDSGGSDENYANNENRTVTICPDNDTDVVSVVFDEFYIENNYDILYIYDGDDTSNLIGEYTGANIPVNIYSTIENGGCLTFVFISDSTVTKDGWVANVYCEQPPTCVVPSEIIVDEVTNNSAYLFIEDANSPQSGSWNIEYGFSGFVQGSGTIVTTTSDFVEIPGLSAGTTYDAYVQSVCNAEDVSIWSPKVTFTTTGTLSNNDYNIKDFNIFPNPAKDLITIKLKDSKKTILKIFNLEGQLIQTKKSGSNIINLDVSSLTKGIYFIKIESNNHSFIKKIIKI